METDINNGLHDAIEILEQTTGHLEYEERYAVDVENCEILGTAAAYTTVETDINNGLHDAIEILEQTTGHLEYEERYACSSAAGGLKMISIGLVPELTAQAAKPGKLLWELGQRYGRPILSILQKGI